MFCVQHYRTGVVAARAGMPCDVGQSYMRECNTLLFECFPTPGEVESKIEELLVKYRSFPNAFKLLKKIQADSDRVCATKTSHLFTAGHVSSQRAESNNARIKKDDLRKLNLELVKYLISICERQDVRTLELLLKRIQLKQNLSPYFEDIIDKRCNQSFCFRQHAPN